MFVVRNAGRDWAAVTGWKEWLHAPINLKDRRLEIEITCKSWCSTNAAETLSSHNKNLGFYRGNLVEGYPASPAGPTQGFGRQDEDRQCGWCSIRFDFCTISWPSPSLGPPVASELACPTRRRFETPISQTGQQPETQSFDGGVTMGLREINLHAYLRQRWRFGPLCSRA